MKYILIIWVCSFVHDNSCLNPIEYPSLFDSWYECSRASHAESIKIMSKIGYKDVNDYQVGTRYICKEVATH